MILFGDESTHGSRADELIQHVQDVFPITITIGLGFHTYDPEELPQSYMTAKATIGTKWLVGKNKTLTPSNPDMTMDAIDPISDEHAAKDRAGAPRL